MILNTCDTDARWSSGHAEEYVGERFYLCYSRLVSLNIDPEAERLEFGPVLGGRQLIVLQGYIDSNAQDLDDRKSVLGYSFSLGSGEILWSLKKQATVSGFSTEAEYVAADHVMKEAMWLHTLLSLIGYPQKTPTLIHCNNMGAISLIWNPVFHSHTKHIDVKHHYIWDCVKAQDIKIEYIPTCHNLFPMLRPIHSPPPNPFWVYSTDLI